MGTWHDRLPSRQPLRRAPFVEGCSLGVKLHVTRVDTRAKHPGVVEVALASLNQQDLQVVVQVGETTRHHTSTTPTTADLSVDKLVVFQTLLSVTSLRSHTP